MIDTRFDEKLFELWQQGLSDPQIAEAIGLGKSGRHSVLYWRKKHGLSANFTPRGYPHKKWVRGNADLAVPDSGPWTYAGISRLAYEALQARKNGRSYGAWKAAQYEKQLKGMIMG